MPTALTTTKEVCVMRKFPSVNPDQSELFDTESLRVSGLMPLFSVKFTIVNGTGEWMGELKPSLDDTYINWEGDNAHFPWAELDLLSEQKQGCEPDDFGGEMEADRHNARKIAERLKASGFVVASYKREQE